MDVKHLICMNRLGQKLHNALRSCMQLQCIQNNLGNALKQCMSNDNLSLLVRNVSLAPKVSNKRHAAVQSAILLFVTVNTASEMHLNALQYSLA